MDWARERPTLKDEKTEARRRTLATIAARAARWSAFLRERTGREGPRKADGGFFRYVGGQKGQPPSLGFDTLYAADRWVEELGDIL